MYQTWKVLKKKKEKKKEKEPGRHIPTQDARDNKAGQEV
jgi:hypothetical protein